MGKSMSFSFFILQLVLRAMSEDGLEWSDCVGGCPPPPPPPVFDLPPPPRPPWLEELAEDCDGSPTVAEMVAQMESCEHNTLVGMPGGFGGFGAGAGAGGFESVFHSVAVVVVCAVLFVLVVLGVGVTIFR